MPINQHALESIRNAALTGENLAGLFEKIANGVGVVDSPGGLLILNYMDPQNLPAEGELVPTITLALKPFTLKRPKTTTSPSDSKSPYDAGLGRLRRHQR